MNKNNLVLKSLSLLACLLLLTAGSVTFQDKLFISFLPYNILILFFIMGFIVMYSTTSKLIEKDYLYYLFILFIASLSIFYTEPTSEGLMKYFNLFVIVTLSLLLCSLINIEMQQLLRIIIFFYFLIFILTFIFKLDDGVLNRESNYLVFGPIVFGRMMSVGFLAVQFSDLKKIKIPLMICFLFGVFMSASKGPLVSLFIIECFIIIVLYRKHINIKIFFIFIFILLSLIYIYSDYLLYDTRIGSAIIEVSDIISNEREIVITETTPSVTIRLGMIVETLDLIYNYPFGVGIGNWPHITGLHWLEYPHNFILEVFSEIGLLLGVIFLVPYFVFLRSRIDFLFAVSFFYLLSSLASGDVLDSRFLLFYSLLSTFIYKKTIKEI